MSQKSCFSRISTIITSLTQQQTARWQNGEKPSSWDSYAAPLTTILRSGEHGRPETETDCSLPKRGQRKVSGCYNWPNLISNFFTFSFPYLDSFSAGEVTCKDTLLSVLKSLTSSRCGVVHKLFIVLVLWPVVLSNWEKKNDTAENVFSFTRISLEARSETARRVGRRNLRLTGQGLQGNCRAPVGFCCEVWPAMTESDG